MKALGISEGDNIGISDHYVPIKNSDVKTSPWEPDYGHIAIGEAWYDLAVTGTGKIKIHEVTRHGKKTGQKVACGSVHRTAAACGAKPGDHKPMFVPVSCGRRICPECWTTWAERAGKRCVDTLNGYLTAKFGPAQKALPGMDRERMLPRHVSFHPPRKVIEALVREVSRETLPSEFQAVFISRFRKLCEEIIESASGYGSGGCIVVHEIRLRSDRKDKHSDYWTDTNRYRKVLDRRDWRDHVVYYPHVHALIFGSLEESPEFHERTEKEYREKTGQDGGGWTYRIHRVAHEPEKAITYLLSHASIPWSVHTISYFGSCSNRRLYRMKEYRYREKIHCQECIDEGVPEAEAIRLVAYFMPGSVHFENDNDLEKRLRRGRGPPARWSFETITDRHYVKVHRVGVYRILQPGEKRPPRDPILPRRQGVSVQYVSPDTWVELQQQGVIPGSWFEDPGPGRPRP